MNNNVVAVYELILANQSKHWFKQMRWIKASKIAKRILLQYRRFVYGNKISDFRQFSFRDICLYQLRHNLVILAQERTSCYKFLDPVHEQTTKTLIKSVWLKFLSPTFCGVTWVRFNTGVSKKLTALHFIQYSRKA